MAGNREASISQLDLTPLLTVTLSEFCRNVLREKTVEWCSLYSEKSLTIGIGFVVLTDFVHYMGRARLPYRSYILRCETAL